jgi:hypothetical protein
MGNLQSITDITRLAQDVQYTAALRDMTPEQKNAYFASQKDALVSDVLTDREGAFAKTLTDATRNNSIQNSLFFYLQRNQDLTELGTEMSGQNKQTIDTVRYNNQLATRQYEINEWSYNNKMDTLFVFQILFVTLLVSATLVFLTRIGILPNALLGVLSGILLFVVIVVIVNRARYTARTRDQRYWNRRQFPKKEQGMESPGSICPPAEPSDTTSQPASV